MDAAEFLQRLDCVRSRGIDQWAGRCPAHQDGTPSLSVRTADDRILLHCFGGCEPEGIVKALGLELRDLFTDSPIRHGQRLMPAPRKLDLMAIAFRFELAALDRRSRAERILEAAKSLNVEAFDDGNFDHAIQYVAQAYADKTRAELFENVADSLRLRSFHQRKDHGRFHRAA